jgi:transcriptional regulator with XRE-family HTH domain
MLDDLAGKRTGERIQILRELKGLSRPVLAGLVGMSPSWLKGIERADDRQHRVRDHANSPIRAVAVDATHAGRKQIDCQGS